MSRNIPKLTYCSCPCQYVCVRYGGHAKEEVCMFYICAGSYLLLTGPKPKGITFRIDYLIRTPKVEKLSLQPIRLELSVACMCTVIVHKYVNHIHINIQTRPTCLRSSFLAYLLACMYMRLHTNAV